MPHLYIKSIWSFFVLFYFLGATSGHTSVWNNETEAGAVVASGNSDVQTYNLKHQTGLTRGKNTYSIKGGYLRSTSFGVESARLWNLGVRVERNFHDKFSGYLGQAVEGNRYVNIAQRYATDLGGKYQFIKLEDFYWFGETGYRYTKEHRFSGETIHFSSIRVYTETERKWTPTFSTKYWIEYLPNLTNWIDWQLNTEIGFIATINSVFSIKNGYLIRYDHLTAGALKKTDRLFTASLVAKF